MRYLHSRPIFVPCVVKYGADSLVGGPGDAAWFHDDGRAL